IPLAGFLSDRYGRKKVIVPALIITGIGGLIAAIASWQMKDPYALILVGRILQGIGASGAMPIVLPLVGDIFHNDEEEASSTLGIIERCLQQAVTRRSEEHTSELQSRFDLVCRLLLEKQNKKNLY